MESSEKEIDLGAVWKELKRNRRSLLKWGLIGVVVGLVVAFSLPKEYEAKMVVAPEGTAQGGAASQMGGLASMMGISGLGSSGQQGIDVTVYPEVVKSSPFLSSFLMLAVPYEGAEITLFNYLTEHQESPWWGYVFSFPGSVLELFSSAPEVAGVGDGGKMPLAEQVGFEQALSGRLAVVTDAKTKLLTLSVRMQDPEIALLVADSMYVILERYMTQYHTAKARKDLMMSKEKLAGARAAFYATDSLYARSIDQNQNLISKSAQLKIERNKNERDIAYSIYQQVATQVELNRIKLQETTPIATVIEPARRPLTPHSPNKKLILIGFIFLAVFVRAGWLAARYIVASK